jgi:hypothetical protein
LLFTHLLVFNWNPMLFFLYHSLFALACGYVWVDFA